MNFKQTATIVVGGGALAAWFAGAATSRHEIVAPGSLQRKAIDQRGEALAAEIDRLHERLRPEVSPAHPGRNLFVFHDAPARAPRETAPRPAEPSDSPPPPPVVMQPALRLSGIAEDPGPDGPKRIAFIAGDGQLHMVKQGDTLLQRYKVEKISSDVVELVDINDGTVRRLALR